MSILKVDTINEKTSGNGVAIPGHVIQFKKFIGTAYVNISSNGTYFTVHTDSTFSITPKFSTSLIVLRHFSGGLVQNSGNAYLRVQRNGSTVLENDRFSYCDVSGGWTPFNWSFQYVDTPSSTSALTYTIQVKKDSGYIRVNDYASGSTPSNKYVVPLEEIAQ